MNRFFRSHRGFKLCLVASCFLGGAFISSSYGQTMADQVNNLAAIQDQRDQQIRAQQQAQIAAQQEAAHKAARLQHAKAEALAAQQAKERKEEKARQERLDNFEMEQATHKENYEEKLRELDIEKREYAIKRDEARANHAEDFVNLELKKEAAIIPQKPPSAIAVVTQHQADDGTESKGEVSVVAYSSQDAGKQSVSPVKPTYHWWEFWRYWWHE